MDPQSDDRSQGESVFRGYYNNEEESRKALKDGCLKTGDIAKLSPGGQLSIVGRNTDIVKLLQGEYVAIPKLTDIDQTESSVNQVYVHAGVCARFLTAIVVLKPIAQGLTERDVISEFDKLAEANGLNGYEKIRRAYITREEFSLENGCLTPSLKPARHKIEQIYGEALRQLEKTE
jgi:long-subunit acyl-CoA synthetase (AMP-forming)